VNDAGVSEVIRSLFPDVKSDRGRRDRVAAMAAMRLVYNEPGCEWVACAEKMLRGEGKARHGILVELGRLHFNGWSDAEIVDLARQLSRERPNVRAAAARLRRLRITNKPASHLDLATEIARAVDSYRTRHPDAGARLCQAALQVVYGILEDEGAQP
jgi:hypothetical protein